MHSRGIGVIILSVMAHELSATGQAKLQALKRTLSRNNSKGAENKTASSLELQRVKDDLRKSSVRIGNSMSSATSSRHTQSLVLIPEIGTTTANTIDKLKAEDITPEEVKAFQREFYKTMGAEKSTGASVHKVAENLVAHGVYPDHQQATTFVMRMNGANKSRVTLIDIMKSVRSDNILLQRKASIFVKSVAKSAMQGQASQASTPALEDVALPSICLKSSEPSTAKILIARMNSKDQTFMEQKVFVGAAATGAVRTQTISRLPSSGAAPSISKKSTIRLSTVPKKQQRLSHTSKQNEM